MTMMRTMTVQVTMIIYNNRNEPENGHIEQQNKRMIDPMDTKDNTDNTGNTDNIGNQDQNKH